MYELIKTQVAHLLDSIKRSTDLDPYVWMIRELRKVDVK